MKLASSAYGVTQGMGVFPRYGVIHFMVSKVRCRILASAKPNQKLDRLVTAQCVKIVST